MLTLVSALLRALTALAEAYAVTQQIRRDRLLLDELDRLDADLAALEARVVQLRAQRRGDDADRLLERAAYAAQLRARIAARVSLPLQGSAGADDGRPLRPDAGRDLGERGEAG